MSAGWRGLRWQPARLQTGRFIVFFIAAFAALWLAHGSAISIRNVHHDQYRHFGEDFGHARAYKSSCANHELNYLIRKVGRPGSAWLECLVFKGTDDVRSLMKFRLGVLAVLACVAALLAVAFHGAFGPAALLISIAILTLPGFQLAVFLTAFAYAVAPALALVAYLLVNAGTPFVSYRSSAILLRSFAALAVLVAAFLTYQPFTFFFFVPLMGMVLFGREPWVMRRARVLLNVLVFGISAIVYFIIARTVLDIGGPGIDTHYNLDLNLQGLATKAHLIANTIIPLEFALWYFGSDRSVGFAVLILCALTALAALVRPNSDESGRLPTIRERFEVSGAALILFAGSHVAFVAFSPYVLVRLVTVSSALCALFVVGAIRYWTFPLTRHRIDAAAYAALAAAGVIAANFTMTLNALNSHLEQFYIRTTLASVRPESIDRIHVVRSDLYTGYNGRPSVTDEFNVLTTQFDFDVANAIRLAIKEMNFDNRVVIGVDLQKFQQQQCRTTVQLERDGSSRIAVVDEHGRRRAGRLEGNDFIVSDTGIRGKLSSDGLRIDWGDGTSWSRAGGSYNEPYGEWQFDLVRKGAIYVTSSVASELPCLTDRTFIIDMKRPIRALGRKPDKFP